LKRVTSIAVTHQIRDAFYVARHTAIRSGGRVQIVPGEEADRSRVNVMVLNGGRIQFEGSASDLRAASDPHVREFLVMTLPTW
jgi:ABC-type transporter Mla maintaining outer membrane lipid asymmetry ATPase subunit MlaF